MIDETGGIVLDHNTPELGFTPFEGLTRWERRVARAGCTAILLGGGDDEAVGLWPRSRERLTAIQTAVVAGDLRPTTVRGCFLNGWFVTQDHRPMRHRQPLRALLVAERDVRTVGDFLEVTEGDTWAWVDRLECSRDPCAPMVWVRYDDDADAYTPSAYDVFAAPMLLPGRVAARPLADAPLDVPQLGPQAPVTRVVSRYHRDLGDARRCLERLDRFRAVDGDADADADAAVRGGVGGGGAPVRSGRRRAPPHIEAEDLPEGTGAAHGRILPRVAEAGDHALWHRVTHFASPGSSGGVVVQGDRCVVGFQYGRHPTANYNVILDAVGVMSLARQNLSASDR